MKKILFSGFVIVLSSLGLSILVYKKCFNQQKPFIGNSNYSTTVDKVIPNPTFNAIRSTALYPDFTKVTTRGVDAVVNIKNYSNKIRPREYINPFDFFFNFPKRFRRRVRSINNHKNIMSIVHGSGVIISPRGYIVTNYHVIDRSKKIEIKLNNQKIYEAKIIGKDINSDIALLKIEAENLPYLNFANSDEIQIGEWVLAIGNPFSLNSTVTAGIVSAKGRNLDIFKSNSPIESFIQTDAVINPGNSGGALININGDLIGMNTAIASKTGSYIGYGFAIPSNIIRKVIQDMKEFGVVQRAFIGIKVLDLSDEDKRNIYFKMRKINIMSNTGIMVIHVLKNSSAIESGLKKGDIINRIDKNTIKSYADLSAIIGRKRPGDKINLYILRNNREISLIITLKNEKGNIKHSTLEQISSSELLGAKFSPLEGLGKYKLGINYGIRVIEISPGYLHNIGLKKNDVILSINHKKVRKVSDIDNILKGHIRDITIKWINSYRAICVKRFRIN